MTDFTESHGLQGGNPTSTVDRRPWKAPRLIDLDDDRASGCESMGNKALGYTAEVSDFVNCRFEASGLNEVPFS